MKKESSIFVAGHKGLVGSAIVRNLLAKGYTNIICHTRQELNLLDQQAVSQFFQKEKIDYCFLAAAKVGGILSNSKFQADFLYENLIIAANVIKAAAENHVKKLLYLGSSCIYPKLAPQPIQEESLLAGPLEPTNEGYAIAKIAGLKLCEKFSKQYGKSFIAAMPTNLYGTGDNFHPEHSHVIPGLMRRFHEAKQDSSPQVTIWGTGTPKREFLFVDDLAEALFVLMKHYDKPEIINVGTGEDISIMQLAELMKEVTNYAGSIIYDSTKPDGTPRKVMDVSKIKSLGWKPTVLLKEGLKKTYQWCLENKVFDSTEIHSSNTIELLPKVANT